MRRRPRYGANHRYKNTVTVAGAIAASQGHRETGTSKPKATTYVNCPHKNKPSPTANDSRPGTASATSPQAPSTSPPRITRATTPWSSVPSPTASATNPTGAKPLQANAGHRQPRA